MILISHRGNLNGKDINQENHPTYIKQALDRGFNVEVDVWHINESFFLGHDKALYKIELGFLENKKIWCHAKNYQSLKELQKTNAHYFWHENDKYTLTSKGFCWAYPGEIIFENTICVLPETNIKKIDNCSGICSDFIERYL